MKLMGIKVVISPYATKVEHPKRPFTGDTLAMLDDLAAQGYHPVSREVPAMFMFNDHAVVHDKIHTEMMRRMKDKIDRDISDLVFGAMKGTPT